MTIVLLSVDLQSNKVLNSKLEIKSFRVNLFVSNPHALRIYEKFGFKRIGLKVIKHNKENVVCSKFYNK